jgi:hypothetical protein
VRLRRAVTFFPEIEFGLDRVSPYRRHEKQKAESRKQKLKAKSRLDRVSPYRQWEEARIHFHIPLQMPAGTGFETTRDHLLGVLDVLQAGPELCSHLEMETYTWDVLPPELKSRSVADQLAAEYEWVLRELRRRGLA